MLSCLLYKHTVRESLCPEKFTMQTHITDKAWEGKQRGSDLPKVAGLGAEPGSPESQASALSI